MLNADEDAEDSTPIENLDVERIICGDDEQDIIQGDLSEEEHFLWSIASDVRNFTVYACYFMTAILLSLL